MSRNRNKKRRYRMLAAQPVTEMTLEVTEDGSDEGDASIGDEPTADGVLGKAGARHSQADQSMIQEIAWHAEDLGADLTVKRDGGKRMFVDAVGKVEAANGTPVESDEALVKGDSLPPPPVSGDSVLFIPITKVDIEQREVWGVGAQEVPDHAREILDYETSKPYFTRWSEGARQRSGGKSLGNVRAMHNPVAAGKVIALDFDDAARAMMVGTKIVDDSEWAKVQEGVYTGFSIGGNYVRRWMDKGGNGLMRYTADPREISLVDAPCIPTATFSVVKGNEVLEVRKFKAATLANDSTQAAPPEGDDSLSKQAGQSPLPGALAAPDGPVAAMPPITPASTLELDPANLPSTDALQRASNPDVARLSGAGMSVTPSAGTLDKSSDVIASPESASGAPIVKGDDVRSESSPDAAMAAAGRAESGETGQPHKETEAGALQKRLGISVKPFARTVEGDWRKYGDPVNGCYKCDSRLAALFAVGEYQLAKDRESYTPVEWAVIGRRIARLAEAETGLPLVFDARKRELVMLGANGARKMDSKIPQLIADARAALEVARNGDDLKAEAVEQAMALMDVALAGVEPAPQTPMPSPEAAPAEEVAVVKVESVAPASPDPTLQQSTEADPLTKEDNMSDLQKVLPGEPASTSAPAVIAFGAGEEYLNAKLPGFMGALEGGNIVEAHKLAGGSDQTFDKLFKMAQARIMQEGGLTFDNWQEGKLNKVMPFGALMHRDASMRKGINSSYAPNIYLQRLVRLMLPVANPLRNRLASRPPLTGGASARWRAELGFPSAFSFAQALYNVPEADVSTLGSTTGVGQTMTDTALEFIAPFKDVAVNDIVSLKSIAAMEGYDDPFQVALIKLLSATLRIEELKILLDNSAAIAAPGTVTNTGSGTGGSLAAATYTVRVTALTGIGHMLSTVAGFLGAAAAGETTPAVSNSYVATGATSSLTVTWAAVPGALAYNVYVDNGTNNRFLGTVTAPRVVVTTFPGSGNAPPGANNSANANGFESVLQWAGLATVYGNAIPSKIFVEPSAASRALTLAGANGIAEFDSVLRQLWTNWQMAPTLILCSPRAAAYATKVISNSASGPYRIETQGVQGQVIGGMFMGGYVNQFAPQIGGIPRTIEMLGHPYMPDGAYAFICESIPYPQARETNAFLLETLVPYTYFPLASTTLAYPFALSLSETLECFHPGAQAIVSGVDVSL